MIALAKKRKNNYLNYPKKNNFIDNFVNLGRFL